MYDNIADTVNTASHAHQANQVLKAEIYCFFWMQVGVDAAPEDVLDHLIKLDTATAFNTSERDVVVSSVTQLSRRVLYVNVTATLGVDVPPGASPDDVTEALDLKNLSADGAIGLLSEDPDKFLGRTTKVILLMALLESFSKSSW